jgi:preprotein translocase SecE subunit
MAEKKPRVRKAETVRERNEKVAIKAGLDSSKVKKRPVARAAKIVAAPLRPLAVLAKPFKIRPVKFVLKWISLILLPRYFRNSFRELRQVTWPDRRQTWKLTFSVLIFAVVFGFLVTLTDYGLDKVIRRIVLR